MATLRLPGGNWCDARVVEQDFALSRIFKACDHAQRVVDLAAAAWPQKAQKLSAIADDEVRRHGPA